MMLSFTRTTINAQWLKHNDFSISKYIIDTVVTQLQSNKKQSFKKKCNATYLHSLYAITFMLFIKIKNESCLIETLPVHIPEALN